MNDKRILLINPNTSLEKRYGTFAEFGSKTPPLGLCFLASFLRKKGYSPFILDACSLNLSVEDIIKFLNRVDINFIGITCSCISMNWVGQLSKNIKTNFPEKTIIVGGPQPTSLGEKMLTLFPEIDYLVIGEGEIVLYNLLESLNRHKDLKNVKGIIFRENSKILATPPQEFIQNLDSLPPPAYELLPQPLYKFYRPTLLSTYRLPAFHLITSRGCPGRCIFCDKKVFGNRTRFHSPQYVVEQMELLHKKFNINDIYIADDSFCASNKRVEEICTLLLKKKLKISWSCNARVKNVLNDRMLGLMRKAGCWQISLGIESGSQKILDILQKDTTLEEIKKAVFLIRKNKIRVKGFFMIGCPQETIYTIKQTINFALKLNIDDFQMTYFTPLPGSKIYPRAHIYGKFTRDFDKMNYWQVLFVPNGLSKKTLNYFFKYAYRKFYLRHKIILSYIKLINLSKIKEIIKAGLTMLKLVVKMAFSYEKSKN